MKLEYIDEKSESYLQVYADTIILESTEQGVHIVGVRFGGYPEIVKAMTDAIYGGGSITLIIGDKKHVIYSHTKRYTRQLSHEGIIYAEATLLLKDEDINIVQEENESRPRKVYLFCEYEDDMHLFEQVDIKTAVPLISEFQDYVLSELKARKILKPCQIISCTEQFSVWCLELSSDESNLVAILNDGLKSGAISIPGTTNTPFPAIHSVTQYLSGFGVHIGEKIRGRFNPLFDPATELLSEEILEVNNNIKMNTGYRLYDAQLATGEALKRRLNKSKFAMAIGEPGSGKTKIGSTALHAFQQQRHGGSHKKHFNVVICPSHLTEKWMREIEETLPNTWATVVSSIKNLNRVYKAYRQDDKTCYVIISKEKARDGYMQRPAVNWSKRLKAFICPTCYKPVMMDLIDEGSKYKVTAENGLLFKRQTTKNHKCECGSLLWTCLSPEYQGEWVKISDFGFVHRYSASSYLQGLEKSPGLYDLVKAVVDNPNGKFPNTGAYRRYALSTYIKKKMRGKIDGLIIDELHQYSNRSGQGDAMAELFGAAKKVIGLTGTLIGGYSAGLFHLLYRVAPELMLQDDKPYENPTTFNKEYGVTESVYEVTAPDYNSNRRAVKRKIKEKQLPGVSPLVYSRFLMDSAVFLSLNDMGKDLPEYEEIPVQLQMNEEVAQEYNRLEKEFKYILRSERKIANKILSVYLGLLTVYPDQPYSQPIVVNPLTGDDMIFPQDTASPNDLHEKDYKVLEIVKNKVEAGERVLIYTSWIRIDTQRKLYKLLTEQGYRVAVLTSSVPPTKREDWIEKQVQDGVQVLIANPSLVETGMDLNDFTTLVYYNISYNLFTLRQSSRRSWRINQKAPRVEVYFLFYEGTMQHRAIRLMASKLAVAGIIEGNFTDEGLAAMSDCADMTTALARELTQGIKNEVEDLSAVFKKMALLRPEQIEEIAEILGFPKDFDPFADGFNTLMEINEPTNKLMEAA